MRINVRLIKKVMGHIKSDLRRLEMGGWGTNFDVLRERRIKEHKENVERWGASSVLTKKELEKQIKEDIKETMTGRSLPACHTQACFAGWTMLLTTKKKDWRKLFNQYGEMPRVREEAQERLGLADHEAGFLFCAIEGTQREQYKRLVTKVNLTFDDHGIKTRVK